MMTATRRICLTMLACVCIVPWCYSRTTHSPRTEKVFAKLRALYDCTKLALFEAGHNDTGARCNRTFDGWHCWPPTPAGAAAWAPCPDLLPGKVNFSAAAKYDCHFNGSWDGSTADYTSCTSSPTEPSEVVLLQRIAEDLGDDMPWERNLHSGEDGIVEEKIGSFKDCLENVLLKPLPHSGFNESICPRTWDGWSCWNDTLPGHTAYAPCPQFVAGFVPYRQAHKVCTSNGTWFRHPITGYIWSNYTACVDTHDLQHGNLVNSLYVAGYTISLVALILSLIIFFSFSSLRCRRITIHKNLFTSFIVSNCCWILWYVQVVAGTHVIELNPTWCQALHVLTQYFLLCNYLWMFCEGLYLHRLLVLAFVDEDKAIKWFVLAGWGFPLLPTIAYAVTRGLDTEASRMCWVEHDVWYTYILSVPVCLSILLSLAFLVNILRVLVSKLRAVNSRDRESARKAVRATLILLPLLGLHYIVTPFRPERDRICLAYEIFSALVTSLQGLCVALLYCFFNEEVLATLRKALSQTPCARKEWRRMSFANSTITFLSRRASDGKGLSPSPGNFQQSLL
ncbi:calcitonin gene-related peptide type 1 receptor-like isoform X2 [Dermacentor silvarum]|uniref:calcitonin gene-related peptide type 1 receptor-like isoform X2 n=1 Tax=Dermacentor silvarum TaxID=543639 RepID=UPI002101549D|nr:calcitonin gene-related peptide type 1 receptor-like isoform X2 [Dermacentor silvarum]